MGRCTRAEKETRVNKIYELLVAGHTRYKILQYVATRTDWDLNDRQIDNYIADANAMIAAESEWHRSRELGRAIRRLHDLYASCMKVQDYAKALATQRELNTLLALHAPPAAQTLRLEGVDHALLTTLMDATRQRGLDASKIFEAMIAEMVDSERS